MKNLSNKCRELLSKSQTFFPSYWEDRDTNHMTMALIALDQIGGEKKLESFFEKYSKRLANFDEEPEINLDVNQTIEGLLTSHKSYGEIVFFLREESNEEGIEKLIKSVLSLVMPWVWSGAFHCLIRLAYAIESWYESEIILALGYWIFNYSTLGEPWEISGQSINQLYREILKEEFTLQKKHGSISWRMKEISKMKNANLCRMIPKDLSLKTVASLALSIYSQSDDNFTWLHLVTSAHALRIVLPYFDNSEKVLEYYYMALIFATLTIKESLLLESRLDLKEESYEMNSILDKALLSNDDHSIKLAYSCSEEYREYWDELYKKVLVYRLQKEWLL